MTIKMVRKLAKEQKLLVWALVVEMVALASEMVGLVFGNKTWVDLSSYAVYASGVFVISCSAGILARSRRKLRALRTELAVLKVLQDLVEEGVFFTVPVQGGPKSGPNKK